MFEINANYLKLEDNYLFKEIASRVKEHNKKSSELKVISLGIGDVTCPIPYAITDEMKKACDKLATQEGFKGYPPEQGYEALINAIIENEYLNLGITKEELFISDGTKCDISNILDILGNNNIVGITSPVYPVYVDTNIMNKNIIKDIKTNEETGFIPQVPLEKLDVIYLCSPNNPTGVAIDKITLKKWVDYALCHNSLILFDGAYEKYITSNNVVHSIYEIEGAKQVAIEFRSFSKSAGFTGIRCSYMIVPKELKTVCHGKEVYLNELWRRRNNTKFNGVSYITQCGAKACFEESAKKALTNNINYYMENARILKEELTKKGYTVYGGENAPYVWVKIVGKSWNFFDKLLDKCQIVVTPGIGFGKSGEGFVRLTAFGTRECIKEAMKRWNI